MNSWRFEEAKSKFNQLVENAENVGPQLVTKRGKKAVVVISYREYRKLKKPKQDFVKFFQESPLANQELDFARQNDLPRGSEP